MTTTRSSEASKHNIGDRHPDQPKGHTNSCMCDTCSDLKIRRSAGVGPAPRAAKGYDSEDVAGRNDRSFNDRWREMHRALQRVDDATLAMSSFSETLRQYDTMGGGLPTSVHEAAGALLTALEVWRLDLLGKSSQCICALFNSTSKSFNTKLEDCRPEPSNEPGMGPAPETETGPPA